MRTRRKERVLRGVASAFVKERWQVKDGGGRKMQSCVDEMGGKKAQAHSTLRPFRQQSHTAPLSHLPNSADPARAQDNPPGYGPMCLDYRSQSNKVKLTDVDVTHSSS
jgi:hypothetical protein